MLLAILFIWVAVLHGINCEHDKSINDLKGHMSALEALLKSCSLPTPEERERTLASIERDLRKAFDDAIAAKVKEINVNGRCPKCGVALRPDAEHCQRCGKSISEPICQARIMDFRKGIKPGQNNPGIVIPVLVWQCRQCDKVETIPFVNWINPRVFIFPLHCTKCKEDVAEVAINTQPWINGFSGPLVVPQICIVKIGPPGSLDLQKINSLDKKKQLA